MTGRWRKQLIKASDTYFYLNLPDIWPLDTQLEPLILFVCLPYLPHKPRFKPRKDLVVELGRVMQTYGMREVAGPNARDILRKLLLKAWNLRQL